MKENLKDILSHLNPDVDQETLMLYLQGKLSAEQQHEVEKRMMQDDFETEAMEGLEALKDKTKVNAMVAQLNEELRKKTAKKNRQRRKGPIQAEPWLVATAFIILVLAILAYVVIHFYMKK